MTFYTIGVYGSSEDEFFNKISENYIDTFVDIRQRRGVRGAQYSFVNSNRLQQRLQEMDIKYGHVKELAPTSEIRELQKEADAQKGEQKRSRSELGQVFKIEYKNRILTAFDFDTFLETLEREGADRVVLFCVESAPEACHRYLVTDKLKQNYNYEINHL